MTVLIALLHQAEAFLGADPAAIAHRYADLLWSRIEEDVDLPPPEPGGDATLLEREATAALETSQRLAHEARQIQRRARAIRDVLDDIAALIGEGGDVVIDGGDPRLVLVRQALRLLTA